MRRPRLPWLVAGVAGMSLSAAAATAAGTRPTPASNLAAAQADASALLGKAMLPAGAQMSASEPAGDGGALGAPGTGTPATPNLVDDHEWWVVSETPDQVLAYVKAHRPAGSMLTASAEGGTSNGPTFSAVEFGFRAIPGVLSQRSVVVSVEGVGKGQTGVRVDGEDVWILPRPPSEVVPPGIRRLRITILGSRRPGFLVVRSRRIVRRLVAVTDGLPSHQPGFYFGCPADPGPEVTIEFLGRSSARPLARLQTRGGGCGGVAFWIDGREAQGLAGGGRILATLDRYVIPTCQTQQLRAHASPPTAYSGSHTVEANVTMTNVSDRVCKLSGYPALTMLDASGNPLPTTVANPRSGQPRGFRPQAASLGPGASAWFYISWPEAGRDVSVPPQRHSPSLSPG